MDRGLLEEAEQIDEAIVGWREVGNLVRRNVTQVAAKL